MQQWKKTSTGTELSKDHYVPFVCTSSNKEDKVGMSYLVQRSNFSLELFQALLLLVLLIRIEFIRIHLSESEFFYSNVHLFVSPFVNGCTCTGPNLFVH